MPDRNAFLISMNVDQPPGWGRDEIAAKIAERLDGYFDHLDMTIEPVEVKVIGAPLLKVVGE